MFVESLSGRRIGDYRGGAHAGFRQNVPPTAETEVGHIPQVSTEDNATFFIKVVLHELGGGGMAGGIIGRAAALMSEAGAYIEHPDSQRVAALCNRRSVEICISRYAAKCLPMVMRLLE